jgi:hypothetical protein
MNTLAERKFRLWYDAAIELGSDFRQELVDKIKNCSAVILFASKDSLASKYCAAEIINAVKFDKKIFPFCITSYDERPTVPPQLHFVIGSFQRIYYRDNPEKSVKELINVLPKEAMDYLEIDSSGAITKCKDGNSEITIPEEVTVIGDKAFEECTTLEKINFGTNIRAIKKEAFRGCTSIKELLITEGIRTIGESSFRDCTKLEKIRIDACIDIMDRAFENCSRLHTVDLPHDFAEINNGVFNSCISLAKINLPGEVIIIDESAFSNCEKLERFKVPDKVLKINDYAFSKCKMLKEVIFNDELKKIRKNAFQYCISLESISLPSSVALIEGGAFKGCKQLINIEIDKKNKHYRTSNNILFTKNKSELIIYAPRLQEESYEIPDSVFRVHNYAFFACKNLKSITIPDSVFELGEGAFYECSNIKKIVIPDSVVKIEDFCFRNCVNLECIEIPDSVQNIGWGLFRGCSWGPWRKETFELTVVCSDNSPLTKYCDERGIRHVKAYSGKKS